MAIILGLYLTFSLAQMVVSIVFSIIYYVSLWRIFAIFSNHPTLNLLLSIFVSVVQPFLIFANRNNNPINVEVEVLAEEIPEVVTTQEN